MNKLPLIQVGLIALGIICIFVCFFIPIAEASILGSTIQFYVQFNLKTKTVVNSITTEDTLGDCSDADYPDYTIECRSWKTNYAMGISVIICGFLLLGIIILREFVLKEIMSQYTKQVRIGLYVISLLSLMFALIGIIRLYSCQFDFVVETAPVCLMLIAAGFFVCAGLILECLVAKTKGEPLLN